MGKSFVFKTKSILKSCLKRMNGFSNASAIKASIVLWVILDLLLKTIELICGQLLMTWISPKSVINGISEIG